MKLTARFVRNAAASAAILFAVAVPLRAVAAPTASEGAVVATGDTTIDFFGFERTLSFNVVVHPVTGVTHGEFQLEIPAVGQVVRGEVESYYDTGTDLIIVGPITEAINSNAPVGAYLITSIRDGGNGGSADTITFANAFPFAFTAEDIVTNGPPLDVIIGDAGPPPSGILGGYHPLTAGNVTIH